MAKKQAPKEYLYGTFCGKDSVMTISKDSSSKDVEAFLTKNKELVELVTNESKIKAQRALIK